MVPLPDRVPLVPFVTVMLPALSPVTDSEKVRVKVIGEVLVEVPVGVTVTLGATLSSVTEAVLETQRSLAQTRREEAA